MNFEVLIIVSMFLSSVCVRDGKLELKKYSAYHVIVLIFVVNVVVNVVFVVTHGRVPQMFC